MEKSIYNYSIDFDSETMKQFENCYKEKFVTAAALMPDAHLGYVAPIGSVLITKDYIVPAWVGFDIGCGVIAVKITSKEKDLLKKIKSRAKEILSQVQRDVPMGLGFTNKNHELSEKTHKKFNEIVKKLESEKHDKKILNFIKQSAPKHLGTLGAGNHFISIGTDENLKEVWLIIHSGSRGIGHDIAREYMIKASNSRKQYEKTYPIKADSELGKEYLNVLDFCLEYALLNRLEIAHRVIESLKYVLKTPLKAELWVNKNHNHAIYEKGEFIHRKGATPAERGERGVIPGNMRDGSYLVEGRGNPKFLNSSTHGAGRALSRNQAKKIISMKEFKEDTKNLVGEFSEKILDESPRAYKSIKAVMEAQRESVKIIKHITPLINWQK